MKRTITLIKKAILIIAFLAPINLMAQDDEVGKLFTGAPKDAANLVLGYLKPVTTGLGVGLNSGWYNTAKAKKPLRFDIRLTASVAFVPSADKTYDVSKLGLTTLEPTNNSKVISPTFAGEDVTGVEMQVKNGVGNTKFNLPNGTNLAYIPAPQGQFTIGLPLHTDVSVRYIPTIDLKEAGKISLFGIGGKVEVLPLILGKKEKVFPVDVAVAVGYTKLKWELPLKVGSNPDPNQKLGVEFSGINFDAVVSKQLSIFTPFFSLGHQTAKSNFKATGKYELNVPTTEDPSGKKTYTDPFDIKNTDFAGVKATVGFQLRLLIFRTYASYTFSKYNYVNAGIGIGIGK